jgi:Fic family protein
LTIDEIEKVTGIPAATVTREINDGTAVAAPSSAVHL